MGQGALPSFMRLPYGLSCEWPGHRAGGLVGSEWRDHAARRLRRGSRGGYPPVFDAEATMDANVAGRCSTDWGTPTPHHKGYISDVEACHVALTSWFAGWLGALGELWGIGPVCCSPPMGV
jgi:hypothetical protein